MSWAEQKKTARPHTFDELVAIVDILSWYIFMSLRILWIYELVVQFTRKHATTKMDRTFQERKKHEKAANNNFIIITLLWHIVRKHILMTNRLMFILSTSNDKQNK